MRKIIIILTFGILLDGCSISRNTGKSVIVKSTNELQENVLESVKNQNITNESFFVQKAEIEVQTKNGNEEFIATIKFEIPDRYLISLKSRSGIEGARIYISNDSILVNDRLNKKVYSGNSLYLMRKYGVSLSCLPLIFGDLLLNKNFKQGQEKCSGDKLNINCLLKGVEIKYEIDCNRRKTIAVKDLTNFVQQGIQIEYGNFRIVDKKLIPKTVKIIDSQYNANIKIRFLKIKSPWNGSFIFMPGKGYELIELV